jgi:hypothetical protein
VPAEKRSFSKSRDLAISAGRTGGSATKPRISRQGLSSPVVVPFPQGGPAPSADSGTDPETRPSDR